MLTILQHHNIIPVENPVMLQNRNLILHRKRSKQQLTNRFRDGVLLIQNARVTVPRSSGAITNITSKN
jgi:hypothetical protein